MSSSVSEIDVNSFFLTETAEATALSGYGGPQYEIIWFERFYSLC